MQKFVAIGRIGIFHTLQFNSSASSDCHKYGTVGEIHGQGSWISDNKICETQDRERNIYTSTQDILLIKLSNITDSYFLLKYEGNGWAFVYLLWFI